MRKTKIICTIGPRTCNYDQIKKLAEGGMDVARLNISHGSHEWHRETIKHIRTLNEKCGYSSSVCGLFFKNRLWPAYPDHPAPFCSTYFENRSLRLWFSCGSHGGWSGLWRCNSGRRGGYKGQGPFFSSLFLTLYLYKINIKIKYENSYSNKK